MFSRRTEWSLTPNRFSEAVREVQQSGREILDLTISNPTRAGIAYQRNEVLDALGHERALDYDPQPRGLLGAREAVADYYRERDGRIDPENLVLTSSTSDGYSFVFRLLANPGDEILIPKPGYPLFEFLADLEDVKLVPYPLIYDHGWQIDLHSLQQALSERTRAIVCVHPNNPTGSYVRAEERVRLNQLCAARGTALIVDEVFLDYAHDGALRPSFVTNRDALTFTLSGLSKISALPQMKLAWIAASGPDELVREAMSRLEVIADTYLSVSTPVQRGTPVLLGQRKRIQPQLIERVRTNLCELDRQLVRNDGCTRLKVEGGWYVLLRVPVTRPDEDLAIALLRERDTLVHPGHFYDFSDDGYLILSLITPPQSFREGISRVLNFLKV
jgi:aspartate/methionine/tyrosine aminotransferase